jgi:hypothetical protein
MRLFGQDNIGRPDLESEAQKTSVIRYLKRLLPEGTEIPTVNAVMLFANPKVELKVYQTLIPALTPKDIKDFLREKGKDKVISETMLSSIRSVLPQAREE